MALAYFDLPFTTRSQKLRAKHGLKGREAEREELIQQKFAKHHVDDDADVPIKDDELPVRKAVNQTFSVCVELSSLLSSHSQEIVVLKKGDLSKEEAEKISEQKGSFLRCRAALPWFRCHLVVACRCCTVPCGQESKS